MKCNMIPLANATIKGLHSSVFENFTHINSLKKRLPPSNYLPETDWVSSNSRPKLYQRISSTKTLILQNPLRQHIQRKQNSFPILSRVYYQLSQQKLTLHSPAQPSPSRINTNTKTLTIKVLLPLIFVSPHQIVKLTWKMTNALRRS